MSRKLSKENIVSYIGDILPLHIGFDGDEHEYLKSADIKWECDSDCVALRDFRGEDKMCFNNGVLLSLNKVGKAKVSATLDGERYVCEVTVREPVRASSDDELNFYLGDLHNHTTKIHNHNDFIERTSQFQYEYIDQLKNEALLDFTAMTDHACVLNDTEFFRNFTEVEKAEPSPVVFFPGAEAEVTFKEEDRFGVMHKNSGEIVTFNTTSYGHTMSWEPFYDIISCTPEPVAIFAHPCVVGYSTKGVWNFCFHKNNNDVMKHAIRGLETINGHIIDWNLMHEFTYSHALDSGFRVSPVASSDSHGPTWGYNFMKAKTVLLAKEKSREAFLDALRHNRFYATESGNVKLRYTVNGKHAPADLDNATSYKFHVELGFFKDDKSTHPVECAVISDYGKTLLSLKDFGSSFDFEINSDTARYFYLRFVDSNFDRTWSMPVFTGREFDKFEEPDITPIDMSGTTATDILTGEDASGAIDGDVYTVWEAKGGKASIVIDLKEEKEVKALGLYPRMIVRPSKSNDYENWLVWREPDFASTLPTSIEIYASVDGENYEKCTDGTCRIFGGENIFTFDATKARYVRLDILSTVGSDAVPHLYPDVKCSVANLTLFE
jgi:hypothetical protein